MKPCHVTLADLINAQKILCFDAYGVLNDANGLLKGVAEVLRYLVDQHYPFYVLTNDSSHPLQDIFQRFQGLIPINQLLSAGLVLRDYLKSKEHGNSAWYAYIGEEKSSVYISEDQCQCHHVLAIQDKMEYQALVVLGNGLHPWQDVLTAGVNLIRQQNKIELIAPNPDIIYPVREHKVGVGAGSLALILERATQKKALYLGKPYAPIFQFAYQRIRQEHGPGVDKSDIVMIGDSLDTDIAGAKAFGFEAALILTGNTPRNQYETLLKKAVQQPDYILNDLSIYHNSSSI